MELIIHNRTRDVASPTNDMVKHCDGPLHFDCLLTVTIPVYSAIQPLALSTRTRSPSPFETISPWIPDTLTIPRRYCSDFFQLIPAETSDCFELVRGQHRLLLQTLKPDVFNFDINVGTLLGNPSTLF